MCSGPLNTLATKEAPSLIAGEELALNLATETLFAQEEFLTKEGTSKAKRSAKILDVGA